MTFHDILDQYSTPHRHEGEHHHARTGWIQLSCPWCGIGGDQFHLGYSIEDKFCSCWQCGYKNLADVVMEITGEPLGKALSLLETLEKHERQPLRAIRPRGRLRIPSGVEPLRRAHKTYLRGRGFNPDQIAQLWGVKGIGISSQLSWRLWIPIHHKGEIISWTTRSISSDVKLRYISAEEKDEAASMKTVLYGADFARHAVIVCEGPTDVWRIGPGAVATMGLTVTASQILAILQYPVRVICFDMEPAAQRRAKELSSTLMCYQGETYSIELESGSDVAEADEEEIEAIRGMFLERKEVK